MFFWDFFRGVNSWEKKDRSMRLGDIQVSGCRKFQDGLVDVDKLVGGFIPTWRNDPT